jgi:hypothetical protein
MDALARIGHRGLAQLGSALRSGRRGRGFKSRIPDQIDTLVVLLEIVCSSRVVAVSGKIDAYPSGDSFIYVR